MQYYSCTVLSDPDLHFIDKYNIVSVKFVVGMDVHSLSNLMQGKSIVV